MKIKKTEVRVFKCEPICEKCNIKLTRVDRASIIKGDIYKCDKCNFTDAFHDEELIQYEPIIEEASLKEICDHYQKRIDERQQNHIPDATKMVDDIGDYDIADNVPIEISIDCNKIRNYYKKELKQKDKHIKDLESKLVEQQKRIRELEEIIKENINTIDVNRLSFLDNLAKERGLYAEEYCERYVLRNKIDKLKQIAENHEENKQ